MGIAMALLMRRVNRYELVLFLLLAVGACAAPAVKDRESTNSRIPQEEKAMRLFMVAVFSPVGAFYIDRYEVSELGKGEFFAVRNQLPLTNVTIDQARYICKTVGKRLCSAYEWTNACLGAQRYRYGYGNAYIKGECNVNSSSVLPTGVKINCRGGAMVFDMVGNVMEWVESAEGPVAMGGAHTAGDVADCFSSRFFPPEARSDQVGFRCCMDGEVR